MGRGPLKGGGGTRLFRNCSKYYLVFSVVATGKNKVQSYSHGYRVTTYLSHLSNEESAKFAQFKNRSSYSKRLETAGVHVIFNVALLS